jgi:hypothetical protein
VLALLLWQQTQAHVVDAGVTELHTQLCPEPLCLLRTYHIFYSPVKLVDAFLIRVVEEDMRVEVVAAGA